MHGRIVASMLALESGNLGFKSHRGRFTFVFLNTFLIGLLPVGKLGGNVLLECCWLGLQELGQWASSDLSPVVSTSCPLTNQEEDFYKAFPAEYLSGIYSIPWHSYLSPSLSPVKMLFLTMVATLVIYNCQT